MPADSDACRMYPAHRTFEEESDGFLLHKINVKTSLLQSDLPPARSPVLDYSAEPPFDHAVSQYVGARHNAIADPYVEEVHPTSPLPAACACLCALVFVGQSGSGQGRGGVLSHCRPALAQK